MSINQADIVLEQLKRGDENVFRSVYEDNRDKFINYARKYSLPDEEVIDIYQDTYLIFYDNIMNGKLTKFTSSISTYLFSIGKYLILETLRKNKKSAIKNYDLTLVGSEDSIINNFEIDTAEASPEQQLLFKYFTSLGKKCQNLLTLFYYNGLTIKEIVETENYNSENVVKSQKSRCLKTLKERIKEDAL